MIGGLLAAPAWADIIPHNFNTQAEVDAVVSGGYDFFARGDTVKTSLTIPDNGAYSEELFTPDFLLNGQPHSFRVTYSPAIDRVGITVDDEFTTELPVTLDPATNGLLVTAFTDVPGSIMTVSGMKIISEGAWYPSLLGPPFAEVASAPATGDHHFLLFEATPGTDFTAGFVLAGQVTFTWAGDTPPPALDQWFEVTNVILVPEPASAALLAAGTMALAWIRRR
jgi:hypothetical protein